VRILKFSGPDDDGVEILQTKKIMAHTGQIYSEYFNGRKICTDLPVFLKLGRRLSLAGMPFGGTLGFAVEWELGLLCVVFLTAGLKF
jgi:hypothetical protein